MVVDPGLHNACGHHADVNALLLPALHAAGWAVEVWADTRAADVPELATQLPGLRPLLADAGYIDPRHWCDLPGCLHQAALLQPQLEAASTGPPVAVWIAHSLLPFQLIALARLLQRQPPARVVLSLMFAPGEVFEGQPGFPLAAQREAAVAASRAALAALALAVQRGGHQLLLGAGSQQLIERYIPLCAAAGLGPPRLHPSLVGGSESGPAPSAQAAPQVLLHWGERKPDKGRDLALAVLQRLLDGPPLPPELDAVHWLFHASGAPPPATEAALLERAACSQRIQVLRGPLPRPRMLALLAATHLALLPYCPEAYAERSSGVLWLYGAARGARGRPARVVGFPGSWLATEAPALGLRWHGLPREADAAATLAGISALLQAPAAGAALSAYGRQVLGGHWGAWLAAELTG